MLQNFWRFQARDSGNQNRDYHYTQKDWRTELYHFRIVEPELLQSRFGVIFLGPANFRTNSDEFLSEFNDELFPRIFGLVFPGSQTPPKQNSRPKFTPRSVGILLQFHFSNPKMFHADFLLAGDTKNYYW